MPKISVHFNQTDFQAVHDFLGRCVFKPKVRLEGNDGPPVPKLAWRKLRRADQDAGQILVECELFLVRRSTHSSFF